MVQVHYCNEQREWERNKKREDGCLYTTMRMVTYYFTVNYLALPSVSDKYWTFGHKQIYFNQINQLLEHKADD